MVRLLCLAVMLLLTSCAPLSNLFNPVPPDEAIRLAITQQLAHVQQSLAQGVGLPTPSQPNFKIEHLQVQSREKLSAQTFPLARYPEEVYRVTGSFDAVLFTPGQSAKVVQENAPFEAYLGYNPPPVEQDASEAVETWFLIEPSLTEDSIH